MNPAPHTPASSNDRRNRTRRFWGFFRRPETASPTTRPRKPRASTFFNLAAL